MLKACWHGIIFGFIVSLTLFITLAIVIVLDGGFVGSAAGGVFIVFFMVLSADLGPGWRRHIHKRWYYVLFSELVFTVTGAVSFGACTVALALAFVRLGTFKSLHPVSGSMPGLICGSLGTFALLILYERWRRKRRQEANKEA